MSPSPDLSPQPSSAAEPVPSDAVSPDQDVANSTTLTGTDQEDAPVLRKPPMRPVRPPAAPQSTAAKAGGVSGQSPVKPEVATKPATSKLEIVSMSSAADAKPISSSLVSHTPKVEAPSELLDLRHKPIPLPSEPKQYRAIGLVRGTYTPSEEEFTRGDFKAIDGTEMKAVLLGRVMSLVKKHIDLTKEHLWVVYPRTRDEEKELHLQIVGVWEPETLKKEDVDGEEGAAEPIASDDEELLRNDNYFSIRGEIVFIAPDDKLIVVKIQQTPRKSSQKAKAFKLSLQGELAHANTVGYFWDFQIRRENQVLVVQDATCIGLAPPKKRDKNFVSSGGVRPRRPMPGRGGTGRPAPAPSGSRPVRSGLPRPTKDAVAKPSKPGESNPAAET